MSDIEDQHVASAEEEEEEEDGGGYEYCDGDEDYFDGFLDESATQNNEEVTDNIIHLLKVGMNPENRPVIVADLIARLSIRNFENVLSENIVQFVLDCPPSTLELVRRFQSVSGVLEAWPNSGKSVLNSINKVLESDESLKYIPSRNLYNFIRCLVEKNAFDRKKLVIYNTRQTSLLDVYASRVYRLCCGFGLPLPIPGKNPAAGDAPSKP